MARSLLSPGECYLVYWLERLQDLKGRGAARLADSLLIAPGGRALSPYDRANNPFSRILSRRQMPTKKMSFGLRGDSFFLPDRVESHVAGSKAWLKPAFAPLLCSQVPLPSIDEAAELADTALCQLGLRRLSAAASVVLRQDGWALYQECLSALSSLDRIEVLAVLAGLLIEAGRAEAEDVFHLTERALRIQLVKHLRSSRSVRVNWQLRRSLRVHWHSFLLRVGVLQPQLSRHAIAPRPGTLFGPPGEAFWDLEDRAKLHLGAAARQAVALLNNRLPVWADPKSAAASLRVQRLSRASGFHAKSMKASDNRTVGVQPS